MLFPPRTWAHDGAEDHAHTVRGRQLGGGRGLQTAKAGLDGGGADYGGVAGHGEHGQGQGLVLQLQVLHLQVCGVGLQVGGQGVRVGLQRRGERGCGADVVQVLVVLGGEEGRAGQVGCGGEVCTTLKEKENCMFFSQDGGGYFVNDWQSRR